MTSDDSILVVNTIKSGEIVFSSKNIVKLTIAEIISRISKTEQYAVYSLDDYIAYCLVLYRHYAFSGNKSQANVYFAKFINGINTRVASR